MVGLASPYATVLAPQTFGGGAAGGLDGRLSRFVVYDRALLQAELTQWATYAGFQQSI